MQVGIILKRSDCNIGSVIKLNVEIKFASPNTHLSECCCTEILQNNPTHSAREQDIMLPLVATFQIVYVAEQLVF